MCLFRSVDAVDFLTKQLQTTTNSYKLCHEREERLAADLALAQAQLFPLRKENTRLKKENHQLHIDSIKQEDDEAEKLCDQNTTIRKLQDQIQELQFLLKVKADHAAHMEQERDRIREVKVILKFFLVLHLHYV